MVILPTFCFLVEFGISLFKICLLYSTVPIANLSLFLRSSLPFPQCHEWSLPHGVCLAIW
jgi:hypothetical protein